MSQGGGQVFPGELTPVEIAGVPVLARGEGIYLFDEAGKRYLDAIAGIAVVNIGHGRREVAEVLSGQARELAYCISKILSVLRRV